MNEEWHMLFSKKEYNKRLPYSQKENIFYNATEFAHTPFASA